MKSTQHYLREFHCHLGGATPLPLLWETLVGGHAAPLPHGRRFTSYEDFSQFMLRPRTTHDEFLNADGPHRHIAALQYGVDNVYRSVMAAGSHAYHSNNGSLRHFELRFDPLSRGTPDTAQRVAEAAKTALQNLAMTYPVSTRLFICMDRNSPNMRLLTDVAVAVEADGVDICGLESGQESNPEWIVRNVAPHLERAYNSGLEVTYHVGENLQSGTSAVASVINTLDMTSAKRIGHGIGLLSAETIPTALERHRDVVFEFCPSLYLKTKLLDAEGVTRCLKAAFENKIKLVVSTDNPVLLQTSMIEEWELVTGLLYQYEHQREALEYFMLNALELST